MIRESEVYKIGVLTKAHGVSGELVFSFTDDVFDRVETDYLVCRMDGILVPFFWEEYRFKSDTVALIKFEGIDSAEQARRMVGVEVFFPVALVDEPREGAYTWSYFTGFRVEDADAGWLGTVERVNEDTLNVLFEIRCPDGRELLLPAHEEFIVSLDHKERTLTVKVPDGLLALDE